MNHGAQQKLEEGNIRFIGKDKLRHQYIETQAPFCAVLTCADSRVAPEIIFDQDLGELFVVRMAGNVVTEGVAQSLSFATDVFKVTLLVVMGHQNCKAVETAAETSEKSHPIFSLIQPALESGLTGKEAVIANVHLQVKTLEQHPIFTQRLADKKLKIVGAYYDFESGLVNFL